jgi:DNA-binding NarL/FixJ family response regulator
MGERPSPDVHFIPSRYTIRMIKILLVDDDPNIRRGLRMLLVMESDFSVVGEADDGWEALRLARELQPDVVVMDIRLPSLDGLSAAERLRASQPNSKVIILTLYGDPANRERAAQIGVADFIGKERSDGALVEAIRSAVL